MREAGGMLGDRFASSTNWKNGGMSRCIDCAGDFGRRRIGCMRGLIGDRG